MIFTIAFEIFFILIGYSYYTIVYKNNKKDLDIVMVFYIKYLLLHLKFRNLIRG